MLFLRVIAWYGAEKISLKKSCFYLYIRRNDVCYWSTSTACSRHGSMNTITNVVRLTEICVNLGLKLNGEQQLVNGMTILPSEYLSPKNVETGKITVTDKTLCIHYFDGSWLSEEARVQMELERKMEDLFWL